MAALRLFRSRPMFVLASVLVLIATASLILWLLQPVTQANFDRIQIGMSQDELYRLLGQPDYEKTEVGLVEGPGTYATNNHLSDEQKRERGFREYQRQQWTSSDITIIVVSDSEGRVACRYSSEGRPGDPFAFLRAWMSRIF